MEENLPRQDIDLTGVWLFQPDPEGEGELLGYHRPDYDASRWREVWVPSCFEVAFPALKDYEGFGWYRRGFDIPPSWRGKRIVLRFEGVHYHAAVWVNGHLVGTHEDGFLPFECEITGIVAFNGPNTVIVRSDNIRRLGEVPGLERGWRTFGGLQRRVALLAMDACYLDAVRLQAEPIAEGGHLQVEVKVRNTRSTPAVVALRVTVEDVTGQPLGQGVSFPQKLLPGETSLLSVAFDVPGARPWSPSTPNLYPTTLTLYEDAMPLDERTLRVGFRHIEVRGGRLWLNGEPLFLTGFNRHEDSPRTAMAEDREMVRRDLEAMRAAGANFVRLCHYPHDPGELDLCDEIGLLAMGEIPLYWWRGASQGEDVAAKLAAAERQLRAMIARDRNHPSLIFWSVSNETEEFRPEVAEGNRHLVGVAKALDPSRLATHVSCHWREHPHFEADDVICVNGYYSLNRRGYGGEIDYEFARSTATWREDLAQLHARYPTKPILITEFGYASFEGVRHSGFGEDAHARAIEAEFAAFDVPYICGATVWCWADHPWPGNVFDFCYGLATSPYGVMTRERRPKAAYRVVRHLFRARQGLDEPSQQGPKRGAAGYELYMVRFSLQDVPEVPFPEGFSIRPMQPNEGALWLDIQRDAEPFFEVQPEWFEQQFGSNLPATQWRCFFIVNARGVAVGTISAWVNHDYFGEVWGQVHWLAVRPAYQRRGLARAALAYCLRQLARWHERAFLGTQSARHGAIRLYLEMGFQPDLRHPGAREAWLALRNEVDYPELIVL